MFAKAREAPSVVSTRVLRTHRLNEVENFRLHGKIQTIDNEIQSNYSQISDEIDGVRKNLNRIKKIKNNLSVSVERRKLLRERGVFVIPSPGLDEDEGVTLRRADGKKVVIRGKECYDGEVIRRCIDINFDFSKQSNTDTNQDDNDEEDSDQVNFDDQLQDKRRVFHYRIIVPPLHPGSRRNFKDYEEEEQDVAFDLELPPSDDYMNSLRSSPFRIKTPTSHTRRDSKQSRRKIKRLNDVNKESKSVAIETPQQDENTDESLAVVMESLSTNTSPQRENGENSSKHLRPKTAEEAIPSRLNSRRFSSGSVKSRPSLSSNQSTDIRTSLKTDETNTEELHSPSGVQSKVTNEGLIPKPEHKLLDRRPSDENVKIHITKPIPDTKEEKPSKKEQEEGVNQEVEDSKDDENDEFLLTDDISWTEQIGRTTLLSNNDTIRHRKHSIRKSHSRSFTANLKTIEDGQSVMSYSSKFSSRGRTESFNSNANSTIAAKGRRKSAVTFSDSERKHRLLNDEIIYDARPDKALSKGYSTMQMTIRGKQVRICVPKFSKDDVIDRARAKTAAQMADDRTRGNNSPTKLQKLIKQH